MPETFLLYGANGYTGTLITRGAYGRGLRPILARRDAEMIPSMGAGASVEHRVLSLEDPDALGTREEFIREHGGKVISNPRALGTHLRDAGLMIRRTRRDVGRELPPVSRMEQPVETDTAKLEAMTKDIEDMARLVLDKTADAKDRYTAAGQLDMRLRHATATVHCPLATAIAACPTTPHPAPPP